MSEYSSVAYRANFPNSARAGGRTRKLLATLSYSLLLVELVDEPRLLAKTCVLPQKAEEYCMDTAV